MSMDKASNSTGRQTIPAVPVQPNIPAAPSVPDNGIERANQIPINILFPNGNGENAASAALVTPRSLNSHHVDQGFSNAALAERVDDLAEVLHPREESNNNIPHPLSLPGQIPPEVAQFQGEAAAEVPNNNNSEVVQGEHHNLANGFTNAEFEALTPQQMNDLTLEQLESLTVEQLEIYDLKMQELESAKQSIEKEATLRAQQSDTVIAQQEQVVSQKIKEAVSNEAEASINTVLSMQYTEGAENVGVAIGNAESRDRNAAVAETAIINDLSHINKFEAMHTIIGNRVKHISHLTKEEVEEYKRNPQSAVSIDVASGTIRLPPGHNIGYAIGSIINILSHTGEMIPFEIKQILEMTENELKAFKQAFESFLDQLFPPTLQRTQVETKPENAPLKAEKPAPQPRTATVAKPKDDSKEEQAEAAAALRQAEANRDEENRELEAQAEENAHLKEVRERDQEFRTGMKEQQTENIDKAREQSKANRNAAHQEKPGPAAPQSEPGPQNTAS